MIAVNLLYPRHHRPKYTIWFKYTEPETMIGVFGRHYEYCLKVKERERIGSEIINAYIAKMERGILNCLAPLGQIKTMSDTAMIDVTDKSWTPGYVWLKSIC